MNRKTIKRALSFGLSFLLALNSFSPVFAEEVIEAQSYEEFADENIDYGLADELDESLDLSSEDVYATEDDALIESGVEEDIVLPDEVEEAEEYEEDEQLVADDISELSADELIEDDEVYVDTVPQDSLMDTTEIDISEWISVTTDKKVYNSEKDNFVEVTFSYNPPQEILSSHDYDRLDATVHLKAIHDDGRVVNFDEDSFTVPVSQMVSHDFSHTILKTGKVKYTASIEFGKINEDTSIERYEGETESEEIEIVKGYKVDYVVTLDSTDDDGNSIEVPTVVYTDIVEESEGVTTPPSEADIPEIEGHEFDAWCRNEGLTTEWNFSTQVKNNMSLYGRYVPKKYTVTFLREDGEIFHVMNDVEFGSTISYPEYPQKENYEFLGWYDEEENTIIDECSISGDTTFVPRYKEIYNGYDISWLDWDGTPLEVSFNVRENTMPEPPDTDPVRESDAENDYTFVGWTPEIVPATEEASYTAVYESSPRQYTINWLDENGGLIIEQRYTYNQNPSYPGTMPETKPKDDSTLYAFVGWDPEVAPVTEDTSYTAVYEEKQRYYTVTWKDEDGTVLKEQTNVEYGSYPSYGGATPTKPGTDGVTYTFAGWDGDITQKVTENKTFTAQYSSSVNGYTITWRINGDIAEVDRDVPHGTTPTYDGAEPTKPETNKATYTFNGWKPEVVPATASTAYEAEFEEHIKTFTVTWKNYDGEVLKVDEGVEYNAFPKYTGDTPTKPSSDGKVYVFDGWEEGLNNVTADVTYTAKFRESAAAAKRYTVTWVNDDGEILEEDTRVPEHATPSYDSDTPTKKADAEYIYTFEGWSPELSEVTSDVTYTATYSKVKQVYTVKWISDGSVIKTDEGIPYGTTPSYTGETPTKAPTGSYAFEFVGWSPIVKPVTGNMQYVAQFKAVQAKFEIKWLNWDGGVLEIDPEVPAGTTPEYNGATPVKESIKEFNYTFVGWDKTIEPATKDAEYRAVFKSNTNTYIVRWLDDDRRIIETDQDVPYGTVPTFDSATPTKESNAHFDYSFAGWDQEIEPVIEDIEYVAVYNSTVRKYTVTWKDEDGTVLETDTDIPFGETAEYNGATPTKPATDEFTYVFERWNVENFVVRGNMELTALYKAIRNKYTVTFNENEHGILNVKNQVVEYGSKAQTPIEPEGAKGFRFEGWYTDKECTEAYDFETPVTKDITLFAKWVAIEYEIAVFTEGQGTASADVEKATAGTTVTLTATPADGYRFERWEVTSGDFKVTDNQFTMPISNANVKAVFVLVTHKITVANGKANVTSSAQGKLVQITSDEAVKGKEFAGWEVTSGGVTLANAASERTTFTMGSEDVIVTATYKDAPAKPAPPEYFTTNRTTAVEAGAQQGEVKYGLLKLRTSKVANKSISLRWNKIGKNLTYDVYGAKSKGSFRKLATLSDKNTFKHSGLKKGTYYKYKVLAYDSNGKQVGKSIDIYVATKGGSNGNYTKVTLDKKKLSVKLNGSKKVKATVKSGSNSVTKYKGVRFESSNKNVATVNNKGRIKGVGKGTCVIYAYAQNGVSASVVVTVK